MAITSVGGLTPKKMQNVKNKLVKKLKNTSTGTWNIIDSNSSDRGLLKLSDSGKTDLECESSLDIRQEILILLTSNEVVDYGYTMNKWAQQNHELKPLTKEVFDENVDRVFRLLRSCPEAFDLFEHFGIVFNDGEADNDEKFCGVGKLISLLPDSNFEENIGSDGQRAKNFDTGTFLNNIINFGFFYHNFRVRKKCTKKIKKSLMSAQNKEKIPKTFPEDDTTEEHEKIFSIHDMMRNYFLHFKNFVYGFNEFKNGQFAAHIPLTKQIIETNPILLRLSPQTQCFYYLTSNVPVSSKMTVSKCLYCNPYKPIKKEDRNQNLMNFFKIINSHPEAIGLFEHFKINFDANDATQENLCDKVVLENAYSFSHHAEYILGKNSKLQLDDIWNMIQKVVPNCLTEEKFWLSLENFDVFKRKGNKDNLKKKIDSIKAKRNAENHDKPDAFRDPQSIVNDINGIIGTKIIHTKNVKKFENELKKIAFFCNELKQQNKCFCKEISENVEDFYNSEEIKIFNILICMTINENGEFDIVQKVKDALAKENATSESVLLTIQSYIIDELHDQNIEGQPNIIEKFIEYANEDDILVVERFLAIWGLELVDGKIKKIKLPKINEIFQSNPESVPIATIEGAFNHLYFKKCNISHMFENNEQKDKNCFLISLERQSIKPLLTSRCVLEEIVNKKMLTPELLIELKKLKKNIRIYHDGQIKILDVWVPYESMIPGITEYDVTSEITDLLKCIKKDFDPNYQYILECGELTRRELYPYEQYTWLTLVINDVKTNKKMTRIFNCSVKENEMKPIEICITTEIDKIKKMKNETLDTFLNDISGKIPVLKRKEISDSEQTYNIEYEKASPSPDVQWPNEIITFWASARIIPLPDGSYHKIDSFNEIDKLLEDVREYSKKNIPFYLKFEKFSDNYTVKIKEGNANETDCITKNMTRVIEKYAIFENEKDKSTKDNSSVLLSPSYKKTYEEKEEKDNDTTLASTISKTSEKELKQNLLDSMKIFDEIPNEENREVVECGEKIQLKVTDNSEDGQIIVENGEKVPKIVEGFETSIDKEKTNFFEANTESIDCENDLSDDLKQKIRQNSSKISNYLSTIDTKTFDQKETTNQVTQFCALYILWYVKKKTSNFVVVKTQKESLIY